jgi:hypothetical protein
MNINPSEDIKALREHYGLLYKESIAEQAAKEEARLSAIADLDAEIASEQEMRQDYMEQEKLIRAAQFLTEGWQE